MLFAFCLSGTLDNFKINIFHSLVYNVILLDLYSLDTILEIFRMISLLSMDFNEKMRMLLRVKTILFWKHF